MRLKADVHSAEVFAVEQVISNQFKSLSWSPEKDADWDAFADTFLAGALLFPSARPVKPQAVNQFIERMKRLRAEGKLGTFEETPLGCEVRVFGNVAVAFAACEMLENRSTVTRDVSATILVRDNDAWHIAAQAWDIETEFRKIPSDLAKRKNEGATLKNSRRRRKGAAPNNAFESGR